MVSFTTPFLMNQSLGACHRNCIFAQHTSSFIETPLLPLQSTHDAWQIPNELGSNNAGEINAYGSLLSDLFTSAVLSHPNNGGFLDSCYHHCGNLWGSIDIGTMKPPAICACIRDSLFSHRSLASIANRWPTPSKCVSGLV